MDPLASNFRGETVLLFGSQSLSFDANTFNNIRSSLEKEDYLRWIRHTVADLPSALNTALQHVPYLKGSEEWAFYAVQELNDWLDSGHQPNSLNPSELPNTILTPLVVILHLSQYMRYLISTNDFQDDTLLSTRQQETCETLGLCTGLLSSLAVSSSRTRLQLERYGSVAIRLAMLIGLTVDARDRSTSHGQSQSIAALWHSEEQKEKLLEILATSPEAYISVYYDQNRATITIPTAQIATIRKDLASSGLTTTEIGLRGRFHWSGHEAEVDQLIKLCDIDKRFQFTQKTALVLPNRSLDSEPHVHQGPLHAMALWSILANPPKWQKTVSAVYASTLVSTTAKIVSFGQERCVPPTILQNLDSRVFYMGDLEKASSPRSRGDDIAIVGASIKVAGADDLEEFWQILSKGISQHKEVPPERFTFDTVYRDHDRKVKWYANFLNDPDKFDHKFFKKSPREAESMDPQQRLLLQIAYQALEKGGYFHNASLDQRIGCYMGVCAVDYENNLACYAPNAFTATSHLRGFIAGKVSHYFGWTGPALTIDTACSSSAVAVHLACQAILKGECTAALAGGTQILTSPLWFQNLAGASFLSKTGQCKPFDNKADGYCRGEAVGAVYLKKMSAALTDGDQILGVISGTAVQQNENCTPIVVPNKPSLSDMFQSVIGKARLQPDHITVVEAHGTGTAVGDPVEYASVRDTLGGSNRTNKLFLGSVKGLVGHCESASGIISLIKVLLMIQKGMIPPQASFNTLNPATKATPADGIEISRQLTEWNAPFRAALINNYGASGSNASMVITQAPRATTAVPGGNGMERVPFWFSALNEKSLQAYAAEFLKYLKANLGQPSLPDLGFNVSRQSNRSLPRRLLFTCQSTNELQQRLEEYVKGDPKTSSSECPATRPLVLCFGGQISTFIGLNRQVYEDVAVLRRHLNSCNRRCLALGLGSIFPAIFQKSPIEDIVTLQLSLFVMQYSCAKSWIDAGAQPVAVVGHSFGELTAICVSGILSLDDALRMIAARAQIIRDSWGSEGGSMMALEADLDVVQELLATSNADLPEKEVAVIACYNGPRSFTIAGPTRAIEALDTSRQASPGFASIRAKRLDVTNAFHSTLVEPLRSKLNEATKELNFRERGTIRLERSTETRTEKLIDNPNSYVADHMRNPVFFHHALQRLDNQFPNAIYLEAGSSSTITNMASRALGGSGGRHFQAMSITTDKAPDTLIDATMSLWNAGLNVRFWKQAFVETEYYKPLLLPPYQFEKSRHWLELKEVPKPEAIKMSTAGQRNDIPPDTILSFAGYQDSNKSHARFRLNTENREYKELMKAHLIVYTAPICPATVQMDIAIEGLKTLVPGIGSEVQPQIQNVDNLTPICADKSQSIWLDMIRVGEPNKASWRFRFFGTSLGSDQMPSKEQADVGLTFTLGNLVVVPMEDEQTKLDLTRYDLLTGHKRCIELLHSTEAEEILQGRTIYKTFANIVDYGEQYRGLQRLIGHGNNSVGRVVRAYNPKTWFDAHLSDAYAQVVGIWLNCMTEHDAEELYVARGFEKWIRSPDIQPTSRPDSYDVLAYHKGPTKNSCLSDIFVFHPKTGQLIEAILGFQFVKIPRKGLAKLLIRLTRDETALAANAQPRAPPPSATAAQSSSQQIPITKAPVPKKEKKRPEALKLDVLPKLITILAELVGLEPGEITINTELADIGVDSLMAMEVVTEIERVFSCSVPLDDVADVTTMSQLVRVVESILATGGSETSNLSSDDEDENDTPSTPETDLSDASADVVVDTAELIAYFAESLGMDASEISANVQLKELGVDSLLSMEIGGELVEKFALNLDESTVLEDMTINDLRQTAPGVTAPKVAKPVSAPAPQEPTPKDVHLNHETSFNIPVETILSVFKETKAAGDSFITGTGCRGYVEHVLPEQTLLCALHTLEAFEKMGSSIRALQAGDTMTLFTPRPEYVSLIERLTEMLETQIGLIKVIDGPGLTIERTQTPYPTGSSTVLMQEMRQKYPQYQNVNELIFYVGSNLDRALRGETDGIKLIFGCAQGRELASGLYGDWIMNICYYRQMEDFLTRLIANLPSNKPLRILEMGGGTGGTSKWLLPLLARLGCQVEYTFTDLAPSLVAGARKTFKKYASFMKFRVHDIEQEPAEDLLGTQHMVVASNAVHATVSLVESAKKLRRVLRPNGILMMLEMIEPLYWIDMIFGLFEGWWLFADGRKHALTSTTRWKTDLQTAGFGRVDWSDGSLPENSINKVIIAVACDPEKPEEPDRKGVVDGFVHKYTQGVDLLSPAIRVNRKLLGPAVLITGGTGSVGAHVVAHLTQQPFVKKVICLNRRGKLDARQRQLESLAQKGLQLSDESLAKIQVYETDLSKPQLGLSPEVYLSLLESTTDIIHNAWPMSIKRPVQGFETQFRIMRNLIEFARDISLGGSDPLGFQFISSIATVGHYPIWKQEIRVPEDRLPIDAVLPIGYGDAKYICELMLDKTLHTYPHRFRVSTVRLGQVGGSKISGYWNPVEHLSFLFKSAQTIQQLPDLHGPLSWTPVDDVAKSLVDLLFTEKPYPIYHIENPITQPWQEMIPILADALGIPRGNHLSLKDWVARVREFPEDPTDKDKNPATALVDFFEQDFERMSVGGLLLDTTKSREHSPSLRAVGQITPDLVRKFISYWRSISFVA